MKKMELGKSRTFERERKRREQKTYIFILETKK